MDTLVMWTGLSWSGREFIFLTRVCWLSLTERGLWFCPVAPSNRFFHIKAAAADWFHWITNYSLWQLICFCSQLQMPWGKCHRVWEPTLITLSLYGNDLLRKNSIFHSRDNIYIYIFFLKRKLKNSFILSSCCCVREWINLVIGAVLPSGQNTPKAIERKKANSSLFLWQDYTEAINKRHEATNWLVL